jgi:hypothetical protein
MTSTMDGRPLAYGKTAAGFANPWFLAEGRPGATPLPTA